MAAHPLAIEGATGLLGTEATWPRQSSSIGLVASERPCAHLIVLKFVNDLNSESWGSMGGPGRGRKPRALSVQLDARTSGSRIGLADEHVQLRGRTGHRNHHGHLRFDVRDRRDEILLEVLK